MSKEEKRELKYWLEVLFYMCVCMAVHGFLIYKHWFPYADLGFLWYWFISFVTITLGRYVSDKCDYYLLRRKIRKLAIATAKRQGVDPKDLDWDSTKVIIDEEGFVDVEIAIKNKDSK